MFQAIFPALRVLRLADRSEAGMHMLYYYIRMAKNAMTKHCTKLNNVSYLVPDDQDVDVDDGSEPESEECTDDEDDIRTNKRRNVRGESEKASDMKLGDCIQYFWKCRSKIIKSDFAITGWLLCPIKEVHDDMSVNCNSSHLQCAERVLEKLLHPATEKEKREKKDRFRQEFREFRGKTGSFDGDNSMWESSLLDEGKAHVWHDTYSCFNTDVLGWLGCRVTSKILGIGSAERAWGSVKHLKQGKRGAISVSRIKKQATIFAKSCIEEAMIRNQIVNDSNKTFVDWTDEHSLH